MQELLMKRMMKMGKGVMFQMCCCNPNNLLIRNKYRNEFTERFPEPTNVIQWEIITWKMVLSIYKL